MIMRKVSRARWLAVMMVPIMLLAMAPVLSAAETSEEIALLAGQDMEVGTVTVTNDGDQLCVTYALNDEAVADGWLIYETHLAVGASLDEIPQTNGNRWGTNPIPGLFPYGDDQLDGVEEWTQWIDIAEDWGWGDDLFIAAHAVIEKMDDTTYAETAWGEGDRFNTRGNWGMWFMYELSEPDDDPVPVF